MFIKKYNDYLISLSAKLKLKTDLLNDEIEINDVYDLLKINFTNSLNFDPFTVLEEFCQNSKNSNWIAFAEYKGYDWLYGLDFSTGEVFLIDQDSNEIDMYCAKNFYSFIKAMEKVIEMETLYHYNDENFTNHMLPEFYKKCIEMAGGNRYESFYRQILGYVENMGLE